MIHGVLSSNGRARNVNGCSMDVSFLCKIMVTGMWSDVFLTPDPDFTLYFQPRIRTKCVSWTLMMIQSTSVQAKTISEMARPGRFRDWTDGRHQNMDMNNHKMGRNDQKPQDRATQTTKRPNTTCPRSISWLLDDQGTTIWWRHELWRHRLSNLPLNLDLM